MWRLTRNLSGEPAETFTYGTTNNRLVSAAVTGQPTRTFTSDGAGNITLDDRGAGNTVTIAIGADGRPQAITVAGTGATTVSYKHNAFGERVSRVEGAATTHVHYDQDGRLIAESDRTGVLVREYLWLGDKPLVRPVHALWRPRRSARGLQHLRFCPRASTRLSINAGPARGRRTLLRPMSSRRAKKYLRAALAAAD